MLFPFHVKSDAWEKLTANFLAEITSPYVGVLTWEMISKEMYENTNLHDELLINPVQVTEFM
jgi:hypothetical protein